MKTPALSTTTSVLVLAVFVGAVYYFGKPSTDAPIVEEPNKVVEEVPVPEEMVDNSLVTKKTYKEPSSYITFDISYPQFSNASATFNVKIEELVLNEAGLQRGYAEDNWKARYETSDGSISQLPKADEKFTISSTYELVQANSNFISALLSVEGYSGGAHGYQNLYSFNYDVKAGKEVVLKDLFPNDSNYLKTISDFSRKELEAQLRKKLELKNKADENDFKESILPTMRIGTEPSLENFKVFTFTPSAVTIYFVEYQIGPYSVGESTVVIPRK